MFLEGGLNCFEDLGVFVGDVESFGWIAQKVIEDGWLMCSAGLAAVTALRDKVRLPVAQSTGEHFVSAIIKEGAFGKCLVFEE